MAYHQLGLKVEDLQSRLTPSVLKQSTLDLMAEGEDVGGGVNALRLVRRLLGEPDLCDVRAVWAYNRLKPTLRTAFEHIGSLYYFEGD